MWFVDQIFGELDIIPFIICHVICRSDSWRAWNHSLHYLSCDLSIRFMESSKSFPLLFVMWFVDQIHGKLEIIPSSVCLLISISDSWRARNLSLHFLFIWFIEKILGGLEIILLFVIWFIDQIVYLLLERLKFFPLCFVMCLVDRCIICPGFHVWVLLPLNIFYFWFSMWYLVDGCLYNSVNTSCFLVFYVI